MMGFLREVSHYCFNSNMVLSAPQHYGDGDACAMWETETLVVQMARELLAECFGVLGVNDVWG